ncbi:carbohydrate kinase family protein [Clostridium butyricum]|uniref:carbohydrate kinase family protein n=1 Tax=Clostridium butyricum TaxID=1492 RepID=UPI00168B5145|nr:carbohydrate kinase [Clostridium butyricum]MBS5983517.1 carbohydrate kinase [Clostridium butyricum]MDB2151658.1 carbohydrate kinase [Clostridium butyricum]
MEKRKFDITAFGEMLIDFTFQGFNEMNQKLFSQNAGGAPANVLVAANKLGANTSFLGKAGNDMHGKFLKETLNKENVDNTGFILSDDVFTTLAFVDLNKCGERTFSFARKPGADTMMEKEDICVEILKDSNIFHIGSLSLTHNPSKETTFYSLEKAKEFRCIISYDPNYRDSLWESEEKAIKEMRSIIPYVDIMKVSDEEITLMTDEKDPKSAAENLIQQGVKIVVITLGADGAFVATKDGGQIIPGFESNVVDTTGAGDAFWGGFLFRISQSEKRPEEFTLEEISDFALFANAVASICVESYGAIAAMPSMEKVIEVMKK